MIIGEGIVHVDLITIVADDPGIEHFIFFEVEEDDAQTRAQQCALLLNIDMVDVLVAADGGIFDGIDIVNSVLLQHIHVAIGISYYQFVTIGICTDGGDAGFREATDAAERFQWICLKGQPKTHCKEWRTRSVIVAAIQAMAW